MVQNKLINTFLIRFCNIHICFCHFIFCLRYVIYYFWIANNLTDTSQHIFIVRELCRVIFSYKPVNEDELDLKEGEIITILSKELPDKGWWKGESKGKIGVFPDNFVQLIVSDGERLTFHYSKRILFY